VEIKGEGNEENLFSKIVKVAPKIMRQVISIKRREAQNRAIYQLGKIKNKFLILEIFGHISHREKAGQFVYGISYSMR
jgi:hypothetical protein